MADHHESKMVQATAPATQGPLEQADNVQAVVAVLSDIYGLTPLTVRRLLIGESTINYKVECREQNVFVKRYLLGTDLAAEERAISMSVIAGTAGVPVAQVFPSQTGTLITQSKETILSVWKYVNGQTITTGLNRFQLQATGTVLGRIHRHFAMLPGSRGRPQPAHTWLSVDVAKTEQTIDHLLDIIAARREMDDFDTLAQKSLRERRTALACVPALVDGLPILTSQFLHGDYSVLNLLFTDDAVAAVIDFGPPKPFLLAYEIGRIAFDPRSVALNTDWPTAARTLVRAYLSENAEIAPDDFIYAARVWLIQLLMSLYGVKNHYLQPGFFQADLDVFWLQRHQTAQTLYAHLNAIETMLRHL